MKTTKSLFPTLLLFGLIAWLSLPAQVNQPGNSDAIPSDIGALLTVSNALQAASFVILTNELLQAAPAVPAGASTTATTVAATVGPQGNTVQVISTNEAQAVTITVLRGQLLGPAAGDLSTGMAGSVMSPLTDLSSSCVQPPSGLVSWYRAENDTSDAMGNNPATFVNGNSFGAGEVGQAFNLDGSSQCVQIPYASSLVAPCFTWEGWVDPTQPIGWQACIFGQNYGRQLVAVAGGSSAVGVAFYITGPYGNFIGLPGASTIPTGQWTHLGATWDGSSMKLYINGTLNAQASVSVSGLGDSGCPLSVGGLNCCGYYGQYFPGLIDEWSVYNRALSASEISAIYQAGSAGKCTSPPPAPTCAPCPTSAVAWWAAEGDASDVLGAHNGTPESTVGYGQGKVGQAFNFTGNGAVQIANSGLIYSSWSIEAWVNPSTPISAQAFLIGQNYGRQLIVRPGNTIAVAVTPDAYNWDVLPSNSTLPIGSWTHVVAVCDTANATLTLYVNGALDCQAALTITPWDSGCAWNIGGVNNVCGYSGQFFTGGLDEVTLYSSALSPAQIQAIYNAGSLGKCPPLSPFDAWLEYYFGPGWQTNPNAAPNADPDHDGLSNFEEFILGSNPLQAAVPDNGTINLQVFTPLE